jgi:hypothetical protein
MPDEELRTIQNPIARSFGIKQINHDATMTTPPAFSLPKSPPICRTTLADLLPPSQARPPDGGQMPTIVRHAGSAYPRLPPPAQHRNPPRPFTACASQGDGGESAPGPARPPAASIIPSFGRSVQGRPSAVTQRGRGTRLCPCRVERRAPLFPAAGTTRGRRGGGVGPKRKLGYDQDKRRHRRALPALIYIRLRPPRPRPHRAKTLPPPFLPYV